MNMIEGILLGFALACLNGWASWAALRWAFAKSNRVFYGAFYAGVLWKILVLAGTAFFMRESGLLLSTVVALGLSTFFLNLFEARAALSFSKSHGF